MRLHALALAAGLAAVAPLALPALQPSAQAQVPFNEIRALNFARNAGVKLNGGLTVYQPERCMFSTSAASNPCLIGSDAQGITYRFLGGPPGWQSQGLAATLETELVVAADGMSLVRVIYNGPPRPQSRPAP
jgi:hypothetical protein